MSDRENREQRESCGDNGLFPESSQGDIDKLLDAIEYKERGIIHPPNKKGSKYKKKKKCTFCLNAKNADCSKWEDGDICEYCMANNNTDCRFRQNKERSFTPSILDIRRIRERMKNIPGIYLPPKAGNKYPPASMRDPVYAPLLHGIQDAFSSHIQLHKDIEGEDYFECFDGSALIALGVMTEELIKYHLGQCEKMDTVNDCFILEDKGDDGETQGNPPDSLALEESSSANMSE